MMNLMHWRLVLAVADAGNITHAAAEVGMTQSGASQAIANLEETLGAPLFTRERRQTLPTALGLRVAYEARAMLDALRRIQDMAQDARGAARGTLRLASFPMVFSTILPPVLRRFRQLHPAIDVVSLEASDDEVETLLAANTVDVGVVLNAPRPTGSCARLARMNGWRCCPPRIRWHARATPSIWPSLPGSPSSWPRADAACMRKASRMARA